MMEISLRMIRVYYVTKDLIATYTPLFQAEFLSGITAITLYCCRLSVAQANYYFNYVDMHLPT